MPIALDWTSDGLQLVVLSEQVLRVFTAPRTLVSSLKIPARLYTATALAARPGSRDVAYAVYSTRTGQGTVFLYNGRFSTPRDVAHAVLFLASEVTGRQLTGQVLSVSGGARMPG